MSFTLILVALGGLLLGGLLNIIIIRLPREKRLLGAPRCTRTGEHLALWQYLPVIGWVLQKGRAHNGKLLNPVYPFVEILSAIVMVSLYHAYVPTHIPLFLYLVFVNIILIVTGAIDWTHRYIYTFVILGATLVALLVHVVIALPTMNILNAAIGMFVAGIGFTLLFFLAKILFPGVSVPFGLGDVFLGLFLGAALGLTRLMPALFYGVVMAGVVAGILVAVKHIGKRTVPTYMPYGSYLCLGAIIYLLVQGW